MHGALGDGFGVIAPVIDVSHGDQRKRKEAGGEIDSHCVDCGFALVGR